MANCTELLPQVTYTANFSFEGATFAMRGSDLLVTSADNVTVVLPFAGDLMLASENFAVQFSNGTYTPQNIYQKLSFSQELEEDFLEKGVSTAAQGSEKAGKTEKDQEKDNEDEKLKEKEKEEQEKEQAEAEKAAEERFQYTSEHEKVAVSTVKEGDNGAEAQAEADPISEVKLYDKPPVAIKNDGLVNILNPIMPTIIQAPKTPPAAAADEMPEVPETPTEKNPDASALTLTISLNESSNTGIDPTKGNTFVQGIIEGEGEGEDYTGREFGFVGEAPFGSTVSLTLHCELERFTGSGWEAYSNEELAAMTFTTLADEQGYWHFSWTDLAEKLGVSPNSLQIASGSEYVATVSLPDAGEPPTEGAEGEEGEAPSGTRVTLTGVVNATPSLPEAMQVNTSSDTGLEKNDNLTKERSPLIEGQAGANDYVRVYFLDGKGQND